MTPTGIEHGCKKTNTRQDITYVTRQDDNNTRDETRQDENARNHKTGLDIYARNQKNKISED